MWRIFTIFENQVEVAEKRTPDLEIHSPFLFSSCFKLEAITVQEQF